jgi:MYXO-CTERM domain-containing protein
MTRTQNMKATTKPALLLGGSLVLLLAVGGTARAQSLRPNIMFLVDTSGSMHEDSKLNNQADGTTVCPQSTTSRLYSLKSGLRAALQQVGTDEANFGLMSFPEVVSNTYTTLSNTQCTNTIQNPIGHYSSSPSQTFAVANRGTSTYHPTANNYQAGCLMSTNNAASQTTYDTWFKTGAAEVFHVGVTAAAVGTMPAGTDFDPAGATQMASIYKWIDNVEAPTSNGPVTDPELHANDYTPLGRSLFYANLYFQNEIIPNDPKGVCRHNVVVIATDGDETCDETTAPNNTFNNTNCTGGGNFDIYHPINQACLLNKAGVKVYVITDTTADSANDAIALAGGTGASIRVSLNDPDAAKSAIVGIIAQNVPPAELCNGQDDNCNQQIDEGVSNQCRTACPPGNTNTACLDAAGNYFSIKPDDATDPDNVAAKNGQPARHCAVELCNCVDDNCNGTVDEGWPPNACGGPCGCKVPTEKCNGIDDDCNGIIDDGSWPTGPVGAKCNNGAIGACNRDGLLVCNAAGTDTVCNAPTGTPQQEICNGIDDNCDGQTDNPPAGGMLPGVGEACGNGLGACQSGTIVCKDGKLQCNVTSTPQPEVCDGIDNDCDGIVDDGNFPQTGQACLCPGLTQAQVGVGICQAGHLECMGALGFVCVGCVLPTPGEVCNGKDNNCDGKPDTTGNCPNGYACKDGACTLQCSSGEFPCPLGYKCAANYCIPQRCAGLPPCPSGQHCEESSGACIDDCTGVSCTGPHQTCVAGTCVNCYDPGFQCTNGQLCLDGQCKDDPCKGITCGSDQYCANGVCTNLCDPAKCSADQRCVGGQCMPDPCSGVYCKQGTFCDPATAMCAPDHCLGIQCPAGEACVSTTAATDTSKACIPDPCATINCPSDCWTCEVTTDGLGTCMLKDSCTPVVTNVGQRGGGNQGCGCAVGGQQSGAATWLGLLLGLGLVVGRRRRR